MVTSESSGLFIALLSELTGSCRIPVWKETVTSRSKFPRLKCRYTGMRKWSKSSLGILSSPDPPKPRNLALKALSPTCNSDPLPLTGDCSIISTASNRVKWTYLRALKGNQTLTSGWNTLTNPWPGQHKLAYKIHQDSLQHALPLRFPSGHRPHYERVFIL